LTWAVPLTDVQITEEDVDAVLDCLRSGWLTMGPRTEAFEGAFADYVGSRHAVAVSSGTAALHLAARAQQIEPGDEVIVPGLTFVASASAFRFVGAQPVFCDVESPTRPNLDPVDVERRLTPRTKAVVAVHFCGYPADVLALRELCDDRGLKLIEDAAQAVGATVDDTGRKTGTVGDIGCFSLFSKKQLCVGEGGMVVTDDDELAARVRSLRSHAMTTVTWDRHRGHANSYDVTDIGFNFRLDEPRAALGRSRLARLDADIAARRRTAWTYRDRLAGLDGLELAWDDTDVARGSHFAFPVLLENRRARDDFREALADRDVQTTRYPALHRFTEYRDQSGPAVPNVEAAADRHCALPLSSTLTEDQVEAVIRAVTTALT
jgi:dTDP-4-amino-4,6-dideoxygalactose transaminase